MESFQKLNRPNSSRAKFIDQQRYNKDPFETLAKITEVTGTTNGEQLLFL